MSPLTEAMIINGAVLVAVLEADLGPHRKIGPVRILRPLVTIALVVPLFLDRPVTHGNGLLVELAGIAAGLLCGLVITMLMRVYRSPKTGKPVSAAGFPYAIVWTVIVGARAVFSYGASNWFPAQLDPVVHHPPGHRRGDHRRPDLHGHHHGAGPHAQPAHPGHPAPGRARSGPGRCCLVHRHERLQALPGSQDDQPVAR